MKDVIDYGQCTTGINIAKAEQLYDAKYIGDFCIRDKHGSWTSRPLSVFYQETPPAHAHSNYFALYVADKKAFITDGSSAFEQPIEAVRAKNGELIYSRYVHDFRYSADGSVAVDGGRDYMHVTFSDATHAPEYVLLVIEKDHLVVKEKDGEIISEPKIL